MSLWTRSVVRKRSRSATNVQINAVVAKLQAESSALLLQSHPKQACVDAKPNIMLGFEVVLQTHERLGGGHMAIDAALSRPQVQQDLRALNSFNLTLAIADLFHAKNLSDQ